MTALWPHSLVPYRDASNDPMVGAKAYFYDANTTTPQPVYTTADLGVTHDQPVLANALGMFPATFLNPTPGSYRVKVTDADDVVLWDIDDVSVPQDADYVPPDAGATSVTLLARTGDIKFKHGTTADSGWVRAAGRTIGSATSGASERANADCEDLFLFLWAADSTLTVSSGRGGSAAGDWAANKTIALPDFRERVLAGLATMGNSDAGLVADSLVDGGETTSALGATAGVDDVALTTGQLPIHAHAFTTGGQSQSHTHTMTSPGASRRGADGGGVGTNFYGSSGNALDGGTASLVSGNASQDHTHSGTTDGTGSGTAHTNMQPTAFVLVLIKL